MLDDADLWNEDGTQKPSLFQVTPREPGYNDLVRDAFNAQEAFDKWDSGATYTSGPFGGRRECTLDEVVEDLRSANAKLLDYIHLYYRALRGEFDEK